MKLLRLHAEGFGRLRDFHMELGDGLNVLHEENGWGKTTLAVFIKAMLYGLPATTKRSLDENERKKYTPWQGGAYGGSLELECEKGSFRIERFFGAKESEDTFALFDLTTRQESTAFSACIGEELFGIDADAFERTAYFSQRAMPIKGDNNSITAKLGNLLDDVDDIGRYDDAVSALEKRQRYYVVRGGHGRIADLEAALSESRTELERLTRVREVLDEREHAYKEDGARLAVWEQEQKALRETIQYAGFAEQKRRMEQDLLAVEERKNVLHARLHGIHPSDEALERQNALLNELREARARLSAVSASPTPTEHTEVLSANDFAASPKQELLPRLEEANRALCELTRREEVLRAAQDGMRNRADGVPDEAQITAARRALASLQTDAATASRKPKKPILSIVLLGTGMLCGIAALLPITILWLFGILSGVMLLAALVSFLVYRATVARETRSRAREMQAKRERVLASIRALASRYGIAASEDPMRVPDELSFLLQRDRAEREATRQRNAELEKILTQKKPLIEYLQKSFALYGLKLSEKNDYRDDVEAVKRDVERLTRAEQTERMRIRARAEAESAVATAREQMRPFLMRYDREGQYAAHEVLRSVGEWEREYRRLCDEIEHKKAVLADFVREKRLEAAEISSDATDTGTLIEQEKALQARLEDLRRAQSRLHSEIDRLSAETDRIPELEARIGELSEELTNAKENSRTIENTRAYLEEAKTALSTRYLDDMQASTDRFLALLTEGEHPESVLNASFRVSVRQGGKTRDPESLSRGWQDIVRFGVRLALTEALCKEGERPFLLLDDPFVNLDDDRLASAKRLLKSLAERYQILYMVCHADRG